MTAGKRPRAAPTRRCSSTCLALRSGSSTPPGRAERSGHPARSGSLGSAEAFGESDDFLALYASPAGGLLTEGETFTNPADADTLVPVTDDGAPVANAVAPGKRPRSSMAPMLVLDEDGEVRLAVGSPGGSNIIAYVAKTIVRISDWRLRGADAIGLPNIVGRSGAVGVEGPRTIEELVAGLTALGHEINVNSSEGSGIHLLEFGPDGTVTGAADPRREGTVAVGAG
jgi:gamma-glutamyltranspeptidase/glutathione hydrolase